MFDRFLSGDYSLHSQPNTNSTPNNKNNNDNSKKDDTKRKKEEEAKAKVDPIAVRIGEGLRRSLANLVKKAELGLSEADVQHDSLFALRLNKPIDVPLRGHYFSTVVLQLCGARKKQGKEVTPQLSQLLGQEIVNNWREDVATAKVAGTNRRRMSD